MTVISLARFLIPAILFTSSSIALSVPMQDLLAGYDFQGNAKDISGNNRHGIVVGATPTTDRFENPNSAYYFDGDDYIDTVQTFSNKGTMSFWIKTTESSYFRFGEYGSDASSIQPEFIGSGNSSVGLYVRENNGPNS